MVLEDCYLRLSDAEGIEHLVPRQPYSLQVAEGLFGKLHLMQLNLSELEQGALAAEIDTSALYLLANPATQRLILAQQAMNSEDIGAFNWKGASLCRNRNRFASDLHYTMNNRTPLQNRGAWSDYS